jgi:hypothetical protein
MSLLLPPALVSADARKKRRLKMTTVDQIGWGKYREFEGPMFRGTVRFALPPAPDFLDKALFIITATEGGCFDAINMYDRCILSVGLIQWCERNFSFSDILGRCAEMDNYMLANLLKGMPRISNFKKNSQGKWRFFKDDVEVTTEEDQRTIFLGGPQVGLIKLPNGLSSWTPDLRFYAKSVAACMANIWSYPLFRIVQAEATKNKLMSFVLPEAKKILFSETTGDTNFSWMGALRAMYLSYAANNPVAANKAVQKAAENPAWDDGVEDKFRIAAQTLAFGTGFDIWPVRYTTIAPVLNRTFGTSAPATADALKTWSGDVPDHVQVDVSDLKGAAVAGLYRLADMALDDLKGPDDGSGSSSQGDT